MSSRNLRNTVKRRIHKERSQPAARKKLGLLEKHKDYKLRAVDHHSKEDRIRTLKEKASLRNPDEFYFGMNKQQTKDGVHVGTIGKKRPFEEYKQMKDQDVNYIRSKEVHETKKIKRMQSELHCLDEETGKKAGRSHVIFREDEKDMRSFDSAEYFNTVPELIERGFNRPTIDQLQKKLIVSKVSKNTLAGAEKEREKSYKELNERVGRQEEIKKTLTKLETQKKLMQKGKRTKIVKKDKFGEEMKEKTVYKWKMERKR